MPRRRERARRLDGRQTLVPQEHVAPRHLRELLCEGARADRTIPLATVHVQGQADDESTYIFRLCERDERLDELADVARLEVRSRVRHRAELVVDRDAAAAASEIEADGAASTRLGRDGIAHGSRPIIDDRDAPPA